MKSLRLLLLGVLLVPGMPYGAHPADDSDADSMHYDTFQDPQESSDAQLVAEHESPKDMPKIVDLGYGSGDTSPVLSRQTSEVPTPDHMLPITIIDTYQAPELSRDPLTTLHQKGNQAPSQQALHENVDTLMQELDRPRGYFKTTMWSWLVNFFGARSAEVTAFEDSFIYNLRNQEDTIAHLYNASLEADLSVDQIAQLKDAMTAIENQEKIITQLKDMADTNKGSFLFRSNVAKLLKEKNITDALVIAKELLSKAMDLTLNLKNPIEQERYQTLITENPTLLLDSSLVSDLHIPTDQITYATVLKYQQDLITRRVNSAFALAKLSRAMNQQDIKNFLNTHWVADVNDPYLDAATKVLLKDYVNNVSIAVAKIPVDQAYKFYNQLQVRYQQSVNKTPAEFITYYAVLKGFADRFEQSDDVHIMQNYRYWLLGKTFNDEQLEELVLLADVTENKIFSGQYKKLIEKLQTKGMFPHLSEALVDRFNNVKLTYKDVQLDD